MTIVQRLATYAFFVLTLGSLALGCGGESPSADTNTGGEDAPLGSPFWYEGDTFGSPLKTHTANEANLAGQLLQLVNRDRQLAGGTPLLLDVEAEAAALAHSHDMLARGYFGHVTPEGWTPNDRLYLLGASGYSTVAENIAQGQTDAATALEEWSRRPGDLGNILTSSFTHIGIGVAEGPVIHWTVVFLRRPQ